MKPTIMVFGGPETEDRLRSLLARHYPVIHPDDLAITDIIFVDLCVVDAVGLAQLDGWLSNRKTAEAPITLPVLLIMSPGDPPPTNGTLPHNVDGVLAWPFEPLELLAQVKLLLQARAQSRQMKSQADRLARVSKAIESTSDAVSISDTTGMAVYLNQSFTDLYGFTVNELNVRGIPNSLFVNPDIAAEIFMSVQRGHPWRGEVDLKTKQGQLVPTFLRADSIEDQDGRRIGLISVHTDITAQKRAERFAEEQHAFERALRDSAAVLTSTLELDEVLDRILTNIGQVVPHRMAQVLLIEDDIAGDDIAQIVRVQGFKDIQTRAWLLSQRYDVTANPDLQMMITTGEPVIRTETTLTWNDTYPLELRQIRSYLGVPIRLDGHAIGFLYLLSQEPGFFTRVHANRLQVFAEHAAIAIQNARLHEKAQQLATLQERQRLARELHDVVSQILYSASVIAEALPHLWERDPEKVKPRLAQLHRLTRGALAEMRTLLAELRPSVLADAEFDDLLHQLVEGLQGRTQLDVSLDIGAHQSLSANTKTALFYIVQEALSNVVKHARATQVAVNLHSQADHMQLSISDNGRGFDPQALESTSMGLEIMRERAATMGASLSINGQVGRGTEVVVTWNQSN